MLLPMINGKPYKGSPMVPSHLTLSVPERLKSRSLDINLLDNLGLMLLLNINRQPYKGSAMAPSHLTLSDLKGKCQGRSELNPYILHLVNANRNSYS